MQKNDCIFCKIVKGEIPSAKIWEDKKHIAILDVFPNTKGMTLVITKNHYDSYAFDMSDAAYKELMVAAKKVGKILDRKLKVNRTAMVLEGMGVNHVHES
jgi:diadenosine tetraphosphate (Ap4A) HIT family hydrolase